MSRKSDLQVGYAALIALCVLAASGFISLAVGFLFGAGYGFLTAAGCVAAATIGLVASFPKSE